jgi:GT2 family glycosyltransferase
MSHLFFKLQSKFLSPNSSFELALRTLYHKIAATRLFFCWQDFLAKQSYSKYRSKQKKTHLSQLESSPALPKVTFLISCDRSSPEEIQKTIISLQAQQSNNWNAVVFLGNQLDHPVIKHFNDDRIKLTSITERVEPSNISGDYVVFCQAGDVFDRAFLTHFYQSLDFGAPADLTYCDCEYSETATDQIQPFFKPKGQSPALLLSVNYLSRGIIRKQTLEKLWSRIDHNAKLIAQEYDLTIRLCENNKILRHIPEVLISQKHLPTSNDPEIQKVLIGFLRRQGHTNIATSKVDAGIRFSWKSGSPSLATIVLSKNNYRFLHHLIPGLLATPYEGQHTIYIVDNGSDDPATLDFYRHISQESRVSILPFPKPFNYSEAINLGVNESNSDLVLLMNDDMAVMDKIWLEELVQWAIKPEIGVVGGKLLHKNRTIQHAGIIIGLSGFSGHIYLNAPENYHGLMGSSNWYRNYLALTGACQMVRREVFNQVNGYDEAYRLAFGDIDFCLKVFEKGYLNVYSPFARLYHYEGRTRGYETPSEDTRIGYERLEPYLVNEDPYFSPNLTNSRIPKCITGFHSEDERKQRIATRKKYYLGK